MGGELREFLSEVREAIRRRRARTRHQPPIHVHGTISPELEEIVFESPNAGDGSSLSDLEEQNTTCPVTRQILDIRTGHYQCRICGIAYSREGWDFLRRNAEGQCCGCGSANTVLYHSPSI